jgi:tetratricopeptide (TPR) repeat protein
VASKLYSTAKLKLRKTIQRSCYESIFRHLSDAEKLLKGSGFFEELCGVYSTRGNIYLHIKRWREALDDFRQAVYYNKESGTSYPALKVDYGYALMLTGKYREAGQWMEEGMAELEQSKRRGYLVRAKKKFMHYYLRRGAWKRAVRQYLEAEALARHFGIADQLPPGSAQLEFLRGKTKIRLGALQVKETPGGFRFSERERDIRAEG